MSSDYLRYFAQKKRPYTISHHACIVPRLATIPHDKEASQYGGLTLDAKKHRDAKNVPVPIPDSQPVRI